MGGRAALGDDRAALGIVDAEADDRPAHQIAGGIVEPGFGQGGGSAIELELEAHGPRAPFLEKHCPDHGDDEEQGREGEAEEQGGPEATRSQHPLMIACA